MEFAFIAPLLLLLTAAIVEFTFVMYTIERATDATRLGVRKALIYPSMADLDDLDATETTSTCTFSFSGGTTVDEVICTGADEASGDTTVTAQAIVDAMTLDLPDLGAGEVTVVYAWSGLDPATGVKTTPLITVSLTGVTHDFMILGDLLGASITLPDFSSSRLDDTAI